MQTPRPPLKVCVCERRRQHPNVRRCLPFWCFPSLFAYIYSNGADSARGPRSRDSPSLQKQLDLNGRQTHFSCGAPFSFLGARLEEIAFYNKIYLRFLSIRCGEKSLSAANQYMGSRYAFQWGKDSGRTSFKVGRAPCFLLICLSRKTMLRFIEMMGTIFLHASISFVFALYHWVCLLYGYKNFKESWACTSRTKCLATKPIDINMVFNATSALYSTGAAFYAYKLMGVKIFEMW